MNEIQELLLLIGDQQYTIRKQEAKIIELTEDNKQLKDELEQLRPK